ncbi:MAG TPA: biotin/lipoyl-binding protein [Bacteroidetes bacterium]|nr:biotin/lipoyl-binding protein [Bacteroidota bacterium]
MYQAKVNGKDEFEIIAEDGNFQLNGEQKEIDIHQVNGHTLQVLYNGGSYTVHILAHDQATGSVSLRINGKKAHVKLTSELDRLLKEMGLENMAGSKVTNVKAPMPGLIHSIAVAVGDKVNKGDTLLILEAMKMENLIKSPSDGEIKKIAVEKGQTVEKSQVMIEFV